MKSLGESIEDIIAKIVNDVLSKVEIPDSTYVENWSEGCQVFKKSADFEAFMKICRKSKDLHGNSFTYTLIESTDIKA